MKYAIKTILFAILFLFSACGGDGGSGGSSNNTNDNTPETPAPEDRPAPSGCITSAQAQSIDAFFTRAINASGGLYFGDLAVIPGESDEAEAFDGSGSARVDKKEGQEWEVDANFYDNDRDVTLEPELKIEIKNGCVYSNGFLAETLIAGNTIIELVVEGEGGVRVEESYTLNSVGDLKIVQIISKDGDELFRNEFDLFVI